MDGYPKTMYPKRGGGTCLVTSPEQEKNLGDNWQTFPPPAEVAEEPKRRGRPPKEEPSQPDAT